VIHASFHVHRLSEHTEIFSKGDSAITLKTFFRISFQRVCIAGLLAFLTLESHAASDQDGAFPTNSDVVFSPLLADPREIQLAGYYYRQRDNNVGDVALGHEWGIYRWHSGRDRRWTWQWNLAGMAYSLFKLGGGVNEFETIDFFANIPIQFRRDRTSGRVTFFHNSSHLGDDYIRQARYEGSRYSVEGLKGILSYEPNDSLRVYGGGLYLLHTIPFPQRAGAQVGLEIKSPPLNRHDRYIYSLYTAHDYQPREVTRWASNGRTILGLRCTMQDSRRSLRIQIGRYFGPSPYSQFQLHRENYWDIGIGIDL